MRRILFFSFFSFIYLSNTLCQSSWKDRLQIEGISHYGFLLPADDPIEYFITDHITGYQLNVGIQTNGSEKWQKDYNYPILGVGYYHSGLSNASIYGTVNAIFFYVDRKFLNFNNRFNIGNKVEYGFGYVSKVNNLQTNPFNVAISSHLNIFLSYSLNTTVRITPLLDFKVGLGFSHLSNGRLYSPNKGLNFITSSAGFQYSFSNQTNNIINSFKDVNEASKNKLILTVGAGKKQLYRKSSDRFWVSSVSAEYARHLFRNSYVGFALNTYYDKSLKKELEYKNLPFKENDYWRMSLNLSYEIQMGHFSYLFKPGIYLINPFKNVGKMSNRLVLRYSINDHWLTSVAVKAHWVSIADVIEWGIAYRL